MLMIFQPLFIHLFYPTKYTIYGEEAISRITKLKESIVLKGCGCFEEIHMPLIIMILLEY
jgi:hypothetical protein